MPVIQPAELWKTSGRYDIDEVFKLQDRRGAELVLAMTHEENITFHVAREIRSYRDLPRILYHFQTKERDEPRPRAGVLRTREFIMKDSYSFDRDAEGLAHSYELHIQAYDRIFERAGLEWYRVESDVGMMGGSGAHEYMAPCAAGRERRRALRRRLRRERRGRQRDRAARRGLARGAGRARARATRPARARSSRSRRRSASPAGALIKALPDGRRGARPGARAAARRSPPQRDQAPERARRARPSRGRRASWASCSAPWPASSARSGAGVDVLADEALRGPARARRRRQRGRHAPARRRAGSRLRADVGRRARAWRRATAAPTAA